MEIKKDYRLQPVVAVDINVTLIAMQNFNMKLLIFFINILKCYRLVNHFLIFIHKFAFLIFIE